MNIGLYFGTFNPIHVGHLIIAQHIAQYAPIDKVWLVVTPRNPLKDKESLLADYHRLELVRRAIQDNPLLEPCDIEFKLEKPSYTVHTLAYLEDKYPQHRFSLIMGEDNFRGLHKWKQHEVILERFPVLVYPRSLPSEEPDQAITLPKSTAGVQIIDAPLMQISASFIRKSISRGNDVRYLLTEPVHHYVDEMNFYR
ncbi:MAG: nicotinate-nucleotide adenylyltransferase [Flavobacteriales bacterium]|jgi:nicotinate-nucleotide adenylyltransferase|nr:nicotinate-nucleotide adenylyltransferase [Flavobacteriales bacterium]